MTVCNVKFLKNFNYSNLKIFTIELAYSEYEFNENMLLASKKQGNHYLIKMHYRKFHCKRVYSKQKFGKPIKHLSIFNHFSLAKSVVM